MPGSETSGIYNAIEYRLGLPGGNYKGEPEWRMEDSARAKPRATRQASLSR
jgi:hypothetical protein